MEIFLRGILTILIFSVLMWWIFKDKFKNAFQECAERAYFEGQKDAINGDIRIARIDSIYVWKKSPWDSGKRSIYHPTIEDSK